MKHISVLLLLPLFYLTSCSTLKTMVAEPTSLETISALHEVLNSSAFRTINTLRNLDKNGVESVLPKEIQPVLANLKKMGFGSEIDKITKSVGIASKLVAEESTGIVKDAIKQVKFKDAVAVVLGGEDAATAVMKEAMYGAVKQRYSSRLEAELSKSQVLEYWPLATTAYNLFAKNKIDANLPDFLAERSVDALFLGMGREEAKIRKDPASLGNAVVTKVFDYYQKKKR